MPMDGVTLGFIVRELNSLLSGGRIDRIAQPEKDEIVLTVRCTGATRQLLLSASAGNARAHITNIKKGNPLEPPALCMLMRKHLIGGRIACIRQIGGDRILEIDIEHVDEMGDRALYTIECEFMGKHSNIMLLSAKGRIIDSVRRVTADISRVREVLPGLPYERPPAQDKLPYDALDLDAIAQRLSVSVGRLDKALTEHICGLSIQTAREVAFRTAGDEDVRAENLPVREIAEKVCEFFQTLPSLFSPKVLYAEDGTPADVTAFPYLSRAGLRAKKFETLSEAMDEYYAERDIAERIKQKSASLHRALKNNIERCEKKLALQQEAIDASQRMEEYRIKGELLKSNAYLLKTGMKRALVPNYYDEEMREIEIALDERLSPQQNADRYFKLYKKAHGARKQAQEQKEKTLEELSYLEGQTENLRFCTTEGELNEIREELEKFGYVKANHNRRQIKKLPPSEPLRFVSTDGTIILVGKNNVQNDKLTQSAQPMEVWMHVKDIPGSHVIVVSEAPSQETIFEAAKIAAYFSKARASSTVPVDYTQKRYVKKPSGAKPGFVIYTHQKTLYVTPEEEKVLSLKKG